MLRTRTWAITVTAFALSGCVAERSLPTAARMCENLVDTCGNPRIRDYLGVEECFEIGRAGVDNPRDEDQCFAVHDECLSDCEYFMFWTSFDETDGSGWDGSDRDGSYGDAAPGESADAAVATAPESDAASPQ